MSEFVINRKGTGIGSFTLSTRSPFQAGVTFKVTGHGTATLSGGDKHYMVLVTDIPSADMLAAAAKAGEDAAAALAADATAEAKAAAKAAAEASYKEAHKEDTEVLFVSTLTKRKLSLAGGFEEPKGDLTKLFRKVVQANLGKDDQVILDALCTAVKDKTIVCQRRAYQGLNARGFAAPCEIAEFFFKKD